MMVLSREIFCVHVECVHVCHVEVYDIERLSSAF